MKDQSFARVRERESRSKRGSDAVREETREREAHVNAVQLYASKVLIAN